MLASLSKHLGGIHEIRRAIGDCQSLTPEVGLGNQILAITLQVGANLYERKYHGRRAATGESLETDLLRNG